MLQVIKDFCRSLIKKVYIFVVINLFNIRIPYDLRLAGVRDWVSAI